MNFPIRSRATDSIQCYKANPDQAQAMYCTFNTNPAWSFNHNYYERIYDPNLVLGDINPPRDMNKKFIATPKIPPYPNTRAF